MQSQSSLRAPNQSPIDSQVPFETLHHIGTILYHETIHGTIRFLPDFPSGSLVLRWVCMPLRLTALICSVQRVRKSAAMSLALRFKASASPTYQSLVLNNMQGIPALDHTPVDVAYFHKKRSRRFQESLIVRAHYSRQGASSASLSSFASLTSGSQPKSITENRSLKVCRFRLCISQTRCYCFSRPLHNKTRLLRTSTNKNSNVVSVGKM